MFDFKKFISGFNITDGEKLGKIIFFGILIVVGLAIYHQITRPSQTIVAKKGSVVTVSQQNTKGKNFFVGGGVSQNTVGIFGGFLF